MIPTVRAELRLRNKLARESFVGYQRRLGPVGEPVKTPWTNEAAETVTGS